MSFKPPTGMPTVFDPSYKGVGQKVGIEIWRVEKLAVVKKAVNDASYDGQLYSGDSYIILQTKQRADALERHIFFWLGAETSQDEMGVAAYKTVELDQSLGGEPIQHREVQGHESPEFMALFKSGVRYLEGGIATGFKHVDRDAFETRLLHVKGRRAVRVARVGLDAANMNSGDVFILDAGREIYQWNGKESTNVERQKALEVVRKIRDEERSGKANITVITEGTKDSDAAFWKALGLPKAPKIKSAAEGGDDDEFVKKGAADVKLYKVSDASGKVTSTEVTTRPLKKELLDTNDTYILDTGSAGIFAWIGKKASPNEKLHSMKIATDFIKSKGYPNWTPVTRLAEGGETPLFKQNFVAWPEKDASGMGGLVSNNKKKAFEKKGFAASALHASLGREAQGLVDDGTGKVQVWRVENFEMAEVPAAQYGHFFGGDSYIVFYTYLQNSKECYIIYFWQGLKSSQDEKGASALWAKNLDDKYGGAPVQVRVVQNKEPNHLLLLFKNKFVVHEGGHASGFKNVGAKDQYDLDGTRLFQVRGTTSFNTRAIQVPERTASLNSGDVFILETPKKVWLWFGKGSTGDERESARVLVKSIVPRESEAISEGAEPAEFWAALGGKGTYANNKTVSEATAKEPRLFQCTNAVGYFRVEEVFDFDQEDLIEDDVMLLDTYDEIFVWIGKGANAEEKKKSFETVVEYLKTDKTGRTPANTTSIVVKQGFEPFNFTCNFFAWDAEKWSNGKTYEQLKAELTAAGGAPAEVSVDAALKKISGSVYTFEQLTAATLPEGVDPTLKEQYLADAEFQKIFGITKAEFNGMPKWKSSGLKKKAGLY